MKRFLSGMGEMVWRPMAALISAMGLFGQRLPGRQLIDGTVSRLVYGLTRPAVVEDEGSGRVERRDSDSNRSE